MGKHRLAQQDRRSRSQQLASGLLVGAAATGALTIASLSSAGVANATCASVNGVGVGKGCTTTSRGDVALGIGPGTTAMADGGDNLAIAVNPNFLSRPNTAQTIAIATGGTRNFAFAMGSAGPNAAFGRTLPTQAGVIGSGSRSIVIGRGSVAIAEGSLSEGPGSNNRALTVGHGSSSWAVGDNQRGSAIGRNVTSYNGFNNGGNPNN